MGPSEKLFLQTVGRFVQARVNERLMPIQAQIDRLQTAVREQETRLCEIERAGTKFMGVYQRAMDYQRGAMTTHEGATWVCVADEAMHGEVPGKSFAWQMSEKSKRNAGKDAA
jgi:hypothetical protein